MNVTPESVKQLLDSSDFSERLRGVNQLRYLDPAVAYNLLEPTIVDSNVRVRYAAVSQLAHVGGQDLSKSLEMLRDRLFNDSEIDVQAAAADAIGALHLTEAYEDLQRIYRSTSEWLLQFSIVATLGELGDRRAFELLEEAIASETDLIKTAAICSLGELGDERAIPLLIDCAGNPDWQIRYRIAQALHRLGGEQSRTALQALAQDPVEQVAQVAQAGLSS